MARKTRSTKSAAPVKAAKTTKPTAADRGVPAVYLNPETGRFIPGRDATLKGDLTAAVLGIEARPPLAKWTAKDALALLTERGWLSFLEARRAAVGRKAAKAAARKTATTKAAVKATPKSSTKGQRRPTRSSRKAA